jgi:hypothetical protein
MVPLMLVQSLLSCTGHAPYQTASELSSPTMSTRGTTRRHYQFA